MAFTTDTFGRGAFKRLNALAHTSSDRDPANESIRSQSIIDAAKATVAETIDNSQYLALTDATIEVVTFDMTEVVGSNGKAYEASFQAGYVGNFTSAAGELLRDFSFAIPKSFSSPVLDIDSDGYNPILRNSGSTQIAESDAADWYWDETAGVAVAEDAAAVGSNWPPLTIKCAVFIGKKISTILDDHDTTHPFFNGVVIETVDVDVSSNGTIITLSLQAEGGGDLTFRFNNTAIVLDCTDPVCTETLTPGTTDEDPVLNYVFVTESGGVLTLDSNTTGWPEVPHAHIATVLCQSAASLQTQKAMKNHVWTDHVANDTGHLSDINHKLRSGHADWVSGAAGTATVDGAGNGYFDTTLGEVFQLHEHVMPALDMQTGDILYVVNDPLGAYNPITNFSDITDDGDDPPNSMNNKFGVFVLWGAVSENEDECKIFLNLPIGVYNTENAALADNATTVVRTMPSVFTGTGFLIAEVVMKRAAGGNWTVSRTKDLRGELPAQTSGAGVGETNTASNIGTTGVGVFDQKVGADLQFRSISAGENVTVTDDSDNNAIQIDVSGTAGETGPIGATGPAGEGTVGETGAAGEGSTGPIGATGPSGEGTVGETGAVGATGASGGGGGNFLVAWSALSRIGGDAIFDIIGTTSNEEFDVLDFTSGASDSAIFGGVMSHDYDGLGVIVDIHYAMTFATPSTTVNWTGAFERVSNGTVNIHSGSAFSGSSAEVTQVVPATAGLVGIASITFNYSEMDDIEPGDAFRFKLVRGPDTAGQDAEFFMANVRGTS